MASLVLVSTPPLPISLEEAPVVLGRAPDSGLVLRGGHASRHHCRVEPIPPGGWRIVDLGARNGTLLKWGARVARRPRS